MSGRAITKDGNCTKCGRNELPVTWHPATRSWFCAECWPALREPQQEQRESQITTWDELQRMRDRMYGYRVEDDPRNPAAFLAICPEHGTLGSDLTVVQARRVRDNHELTHTA